MLLGFYAEPSVGRVHATRSNKERDSNSTTWPQQTSHAERDKKKTSRIIKPTPSKLMDNGLTSLSDRGQLPDMGSAQRLARGRFSQPPTLSSSLLTYALSLSSRVSFRLGPT